MERKLDLFLVGFEGHEAIAIHTKAVLCLVGSGDAGTVLSEIWAEALHRAAKADLNARASGRMALSG